MVCEPGWFPCQSEEVCVERRFICDDHFDCVDHSDEWNCTDHHVDDFVDMLFRKRPDEDSEKRRGRCELEEPPKECRCADLSLFCESRRLQAVPSPLPPTARYLDISGNFIPALTSSTFSRLPHLRVLVVIRAGVRELRRGVFSSMAQIDEIHLTGHDIHTLENGTMEGTGSLTHLQLSSNNISDVSDGFFVHNINLKRLELNDNQLSRLRPSMFRGLASLRNLYVERNKMRHLEAHVFDEVPNLQFLYLGSNQLRTIAPGTFRRLSHLHLLSLERNLLATLTNGTFHGLARLKTLILQDNGVEEVEQGTFSELVSVESMNLQGSHLQDGPQTAVFGNMTSLEYIYFDEFRLCSLALHVRVCEPKGDGISSVEHLLDSLVLRISVWVMGVLACVGNLVVLIGRFVVKEPNQVHSFYIKNLSLSDFLMGIYLFVIASYDASFRGAYIRHEYTWRRSWQCSLCGFLSTLSSEASVFTLTTITLDRYFSIVHPLTLKERTLRAAVVVMGCIWMVAVVLALLPVSGLNYYGDNFYGSNGMCLPLHIHDPYAKAWEHSAIIFIGLNLVAFMFIAYAYGRMILSIRESQSSLRSTQEKQDRVLVKRFAFIVGTDFLCWMPVIIIKFIALGGVVIDKTLYAWLAVFVLPVNSALNPILYTLATKIFKQQVVKMVFNMSRWPTAPPRPGNDSNPPTHTSLYTEVASTPVRCRHGPAPRGSTGHVPQVLTPEGSTEGARLPRSHAPVRLLVKFEVPHLPRSSLSSLAPLSDSVIDSSGPARLQNQ
ncbi:relaxin receptor 1-like [Portunus trituberculatus]|uniref:relaxin receptor 1-like n=1 Tax=Portunus trituberculatus TaxID=210409 RepID=UPI001E1CC831|nr:relaxin receptor 1-like [Portunus trituberculatus]